MRRYLLHIPCDLRRQKALAREKLQPVPLLYVEQHGQFRELGGVSQSLCVSAKYCYATHELRLHQNDRCKRFALCLVLTVRFRSLAPWGKLF